MSISCRDDDLLFSDVAEKVVPVPQDKQSLIRHLEKTSPETIALAHEWDDLIQAIAKTGEKMKR